MTRTEIEAFFTRRERLWFDHDAAGLAADHAEGSVVESPTHGKLTTRDAIRGVYDTWFAAFHDLKFRHHDILVDGNLAAVFFTTSGTHKKAFAGAPATARSVTIPAWRCSHSRMDESFTRSGSTTPRRCSCRLV